MIKMGKHWSLSKETRERQSKAAKIRSQKPEFKKRISELNKGVPKSTETKRRMSIAKLGKPKSNEHKLNMSKSHKLRIKIVHCIQEEFGCSFREAQHKLRDFKKMYYDKYQYQDQKED